MKRKKERQVNAVQEEEEDDEVTTGNESDVESIDNSEETNDIVYSIQENMDTNDTLDIDGLTGIGVDYQDGFMINLSDNWNEEIKTAEECKEETPEILHSINERISHSHITAQFDNGSDATTTCHRHILHDYKPINFKKSLTDAGKNVHECIGEGFIKIPTDNNGFKMIRSWHTPSMPVTILSPGDIVKYESNIFSGFMTTTDYDNNEGKATFVGRRNRHTITIPLSVIGKLLFTKPIVPPIVTYEETNTVSTITDETLKTLWHQRLCHLNKRMVTEMHKYADGIPKMSSPDTPLEGCPTCFVCKMKNATKQKGDIRADATEFGQGISIDWGFIVQRSSDTTRAKLLTSIDGDQSYLLLADHATHRLFGIPTGSKRPPVTWLHRWLTRFKSQNPNRIACMDQGGELGNSQEIKDLLEKHGFSIRLTAPESSHQNSPAERPHQIIGNAIRSMLHGANMPLNLWHYAFNHLLRIHSYIPHAGQTVSPHEAMGNTRPNISKLRTFGCRVYVKTPTRKSHKLDWDKVAKGLFLGYTGTMSQIYYFDLRTKRIKTATHVKYDEGMTDLEMKDKPPNALHLTNARTKLVPLLNDIEVPPPTELSLEVMQSPFPDLQTVTLPIKCNNDNLGIELDECTERKRAFLQTITPRSTASGIRKWKQNIIRSYIIEIDGKPIFTVQDANIALKKALQDAQHKRDPFITLVFAADRQAMDTEYRSTTRIQIDQLRNSIKTLYEMKEGEPIKETDMPNDDEIVMAIKGTAAMDIKAKMTRRHLKQLPEWKEWQNAEYAMLDKMLANEMYGKPIRRPRNVIVLRQVWSYTIKADGTRQARNCCDGSKINKGLKYARTYSACIGQTSQRLFFSLAASRNYIVMAGDATNAYAQSPPPSESTYVNVDAPYIDWYEQKFGIKLTTDMVLPVQHALQGHPESGVLWATKISKHLLDMGMINTDHEPCIYSGTYQQHDILACRQVDDFAFAAEHRETLDAVLQDLATRIDFIPEDKLLSKYNGIDVEQTRDYIRIHSATYIEKILTDHNWTTPSKTDHPLREPIPPSAVDQIMREVGPTDDNDAKDLESRMGYSYRTIIGELIFAYVTTRIDIGNAISLLSRYNNAPHQIHYEMAKRVLRFLRQTKKRGLIYWRTRSRDDLPVGDITPREMEDIEQDYPYPSSPSRVCGYVDASHAPCLTTRKSIGAYSIHLGGTSIAYKTKLQPTVATSSTEAEFIAAVACAKELLHIRSILQQLNIPQDGPSTIYEDNMAAIAMANAGKPTIRTRHIDIQFFALQEWIQRGDIFLQHIPGAINPADCLTKTLFRLLFWRHISRLMGYTGPLYLES